MQNKIFHANAVIHNKLHRGSDNDREILDNFWINSVKAAQCMYSWIPNLGKKADDRKSWVADTLHVASQPPSV